MWAIGISAALCLGLGFAPAQAQAQEPQDGELAPTRVLDTVMVSGRQPGPGLWRVSRDGHELWLLGTLTPLPRRMVWSSEQVEAAIARSQRLLMPPRAEVRADAALGGLFLLPSLLKARNNPGRQLLKDQVPAADYARWLALKRTYLGRDRGVEKRRPILAAAELYEAALRASDLSVDNVAAKAARRAARRHNVKIVQPSVKLLISDPKAALKEFSGSALDDLDCFRRSLDRIEFDLETIKLRANAWALGEIGILRSLPLTDAAQSCTTALLQHRVAQGLGLDDLPARVESAWLDAAQAALAEHPRSFALLPIDQLLRADGLLARLAARGYAVQPPAESR